MKQKNGGKLVNEKWGIFDEYKIKQKVVKNKFVFPECSR